MVRLLLAVTLMLEGYSRAEAAQLNGMIGKPCETRSTATATKVSVEQMILKRHRIRVDAGTVLRTLGEPAIKVADDVP